ncbi:MAG: hypothetical protein LUF34_04790 [Lachnospiraceae bacterium]|nr:hypothetical protein [Lachnospiraceae bacterium]
MKKQYMGLAILMTALLLGGCASTASGTDETTTAAQTTVEETSSAAETTTESVEEGTSEAAFAEETTEGAADTSTENLGYTEEAQDAFLDLMDDCADVAPGTAGTSLRTAAAAAGLLDWEEEQADSSLSEDDIKDLMAAWKAARTEDDWAYLQESWSQVAASMREIAADPEGQAELVEDAGYTLEHTSYQTDVMEMVIGAIEETLSE